MNEYLIVSLCSDKSIFKPIPYYLGEVEIRTGKYDTELEKESIHKSMELLSEKITDQIAPRIVTVCHANNPTEAFMVARERFDETLDLLNILINHIGEFSLAKSGFVREVFTGNIHPVTPNMHMVLHQTPLSPTPMFFMEKESFPQLSMIDYIFNILPPSHELIERLKRGSHWVRKARNELNIQLRILFRWFAMEAAWKVAEEDDIVPKIMLSLGFPTGQKINLVDANIMAQLTSHTDYKSWRDQIKKRLQKVKDLRNDSVHSGFRSWDISRTDLLRYDHLATLGCSRLLYLLEKAIELNYLKIVDADRDIVYIWQNKLNIVQDCHGTIIYSLNNPNFI